MIWTRGKTALTSRLFTPVLADAETGQLVSARGLPWYLRALEISRPLHFGDYGGVPLKIIWALLDLITIVVLGSGLYLWFARSRPALDEYLVEFNKGARKFMDDENPQIAKHLKVVAFIQDDDSKEILQAVQIDVPNAK